MMDNRPIRVDTLDGLITALQSGMPSSSITITSADLDGVDLTGRILSGMTIENASLRSARLENVDLSQAKILGCDFRGANLRNSNLSGAIISATRQPVKDAELVEVDISEMKI
jgi:uncharacterized protein YjbI with pentapeptide repeats